jgi:transposase
VVLDNAPAHVARAFTARRTELAALGIELFYLPPRSPELNPIERVWRSAKYEDYPQRSHTSTDAIATAVDQALTKQRSRIRGSAPHFVKTA